MQLRRPICFAHSQRMYTPLHGISRHLQLNSTSGNLDGSNRTKFSAPRIPCPQDQFSHDIRIQYIYHICIHRADPDVSMDEFRTNMMTLADEWRKLPQAQKLAHSFDFVFMNNMMDAYVKAAGLPDPRPILIGKLECELHKLPEIVKFLQHREYRTDRDVSLFTANADIKFEKQSSLAPANRAHCLAISRRLDLLLDRFLERPAVQKNLLKLTLLCQDSSMNESLHEVGAFRFTRHIHSSFTENTRYNQQDLMEVSRYRLSLRNTNLTSLLDDECCRGVSPGTHC
ncbi:hypothetical protein FB45DRAFT_907085 [Roridomyces roridus]|uniref:Uncharacterized protein n=1 Tax=Roridomyces roridus TaxID=1738132 RepID=A0AAD7C1K7_9AGAR|nr:hypothetical protein FB45DRAFT_907085 [Roridomyces roridus]